MIEKFKNELQYLRISTILIGIGILISLIVVVFPLISNVLLSRNNGEVTMSVTAEASVTESITSDTTATPTFVSGVIKTQALLFTATPTRLGNSTLTPTQTLTSTPINTATQETITTTPTNTLTATSTIEFTPEQCFITNYADSGIRGNPNINANLLLSLRFKIKIFALDIETPILDSTADYYWQYVQDPETGQEGWIAEKRADNSQVFLSIDSNCDGDADD